MKNINITVENKRATVVGSPVIICGNSDYTVTFAFDSDWNVTGVRTARFVYVKDGKVQHEDVVFSGNTVAVPILSGIDSVKIGVFAGELRTTTPAVVRCGASILCGSGEVHEPTPDVYDQIMALFNDLAERGGFGATEAQAQQIAQNQADIAELVSGTKKAGKAADADKLGGQKADYYAAAAELKKGAYPLTTVGKARFILYPDGGTFDSTATVAGQLRITLPQLWGNTRISFKVSINTHSNSNFNEYIVSGYLSTGESAWSLNSAISNGDMNHTVYFGHDGSKCVVCIGEPSTTWNRVKVQISEVFVGHYGYDYNRWSTGWAVNVVADNSDLTVNGTVENPNVLAKYLPLVGGRLTGGLAIGSQDQTERMAVELVNALRSVSLQVTVDGDIRLRSGSKNIIFSGVDGTTTFDGTASGNLSLKGGTLDGALGIKATSNANSARSLAFKNYDDTSFGGVGVYSNNGVIQYLYLGTSYEKSKNLSVTADEIKWKNKDLLHTGNSAKVHIGTSAPSDTSALWIDTSA